MTRLPSAIERLIHELTRLPGVGRRAAERIVTSLLEAPPDRAESLRDALGRLRVEVAFCSRCGAWAEGALCGVCSDPNRDAGTLLVVERPADLYSFEGSGAFRGRYHVLGGTLSPMRGVAASDLSVDRLLERVQEERVTEVILATSPTVEGDATAHYLAQALAPSGARVARIGMGLPLGASLGYADPGTLKLAIEGRRNF